MKKRLSIVALILMVVMAFTLVGCGPKPSGNSGGNSSDEKDVALDLSTVESDGAKVKMSVLYENNDTRMRFINGGTAAPYSSTVDGKQYRVPDFKPAWQALQEKQNFTIEDVTPPQAGSVSKAYDLLQGEDFNNVNILSGSVSTIVEDATKQDAFVNLAPYIENGSMPYLKRFLDKYDLVKKSVTSADGKVFYAPYFDGFDDIETMFIVRKDWVEKLLDVADPETAGYNTDKILSAQYQGYYKEMNTTFKAMKGADQTQEVKLQYANGQGIIDRQNKLETRSGKALTTELINYIKEHYVSKGYIDKPSDLFCGQNACYNADELIALLRCVKTNPVYLMGKDQPIYPFYPRSKDVNRINAVIQLSQLWGVRGYDSRNNYFYINASGYLADGRTSPDMLEALGFLRQLCQEGLIFQTYNKGIGDNIEYRSSFNNQNSGFMTYDYNQTTTIFNETLKNQAHGAVINLSPILFPVADWDNKAVYAGANKVHPTESGFAGYKVEGDNVLYQYTESWRSIKTEAWTITSHTKNDLKTFKKCIELFDYMYSPEGQILMSYGPDAFVKVKDASVDLNSLVKNINDADYDEKLQALIEQKYETVDYYDRKVPAISDACLAELKNKDIGAGNYTNYYRYYVGATLPIGYEKEQGMEYQTVDAKGKIGLDYIVNAVEKGVLRHAQVNKGGDENDGALRDTNLSNTLVPTTFPLSEAQNNTILTKCQTLLTKFNNSSANGENEFHNYILVGFDRTSGNITTLTPADLKKQVEEEWGGNEFLRQYSDAYDRMYGLD